MYYLDRYILSFLSFSTSARAETHGLIECLILHVCILYNIASDEGNYFTAK